MIRTRTDKTIFTTLLTILIICLVMGWVAGCSATPTTPTTTRQEQVQAYLTAHGQSPIQSDKWEKYEAQAIKTCESDNPYYLIALAMYARRSEALGHAIRAGIAVYCPDRLTDWDKAAKTGTATT